MDTQKVFIVMASSLLLLALAGCHNASSNVGEALGCTLAGNGCDDGRTGPQGVPGVNGINGANGSNGSSCTVQSVASSPAAPNGGARISCTDGTEALVLNGADGDDAPPTPYTITQVIKPCPTVSGANPEVLLVLANRSLLASVSQSAGSNTRLAFVTPGNYTTTDGRSCAFSVTAGSVSWTGGSASY